MSDLAELQKLCRAGVHVTINDHRDMYETVEQYMTSFEDEDAEDVPIEDMKRLDTIVQVQFYPRTPIGFYRVFGADVDETLHQALELAREVVTAEAQS